MSGSMSGSMSMPGMMSDADMRQLEQTNGAAFDRLWVQLMITHHHGAVAMAHNEVTDGQNPTAKTLATSIVTSQTAQIDQLQKLLAAL